MIYSIAKTDRERNNYVIFVQKNIIKQIKHFKFIIINTIASFAFCRLVENHRIFVTGRTLTKFLTRAERASTTEWVKFLSEICKSYISATFYTRLFVHNLAATLNLSNIYSPFIFILYTTSFFFLNKPLKSKKL